MAAGKGNTDNAASRRKPEVVFFNDYFAPYSVGGAERLLGLLAQGLSDQGVKSTVITPHYRGSPRTDRVGSVRVFRVGDYPDFNHFLRAHSGTSPTLKARRAGLDFAQFRRGGAGSVFHFHGLWRFSTSIIQKMDGKKVMTLHDYGPFCIRRVMVRTSGRLCPGPNFIQCALCHFSGPTTLGSLNPIKPQVWYSNNKHFLAALDSIIAPSLYMKRFLAAQLGSQDKVDLIYNGVDTQRFTPGRDVDRRGILFVGRPSPLKGVHFLLDVYRKLPAPRPTLLMVGPAPGSFSVPEGVELLGKVSDETLLGLYQASTCLAAPSQWPENCSMVLLEAMSSGLPVLASNLGGNPELVEHGVTGFVLPHNKTESWIESIILLAQDPSLSRQMGAASRARVLQRFSLEDCVSRHIQLYNRLINRGEVT